MPANGTILDAYLNSHATIEVRHVRCFILRWTGLVCVVIQGVLTGWNSYGGWSDLLSEAGIASHCRTRLLDSSLALEFIQVKAGLSLRNLPAILRKNVTNSVTKELPRTTYTSFPLSPVVAAAVCTLKWSYFGVISESLWKGENKKSVGFGSGSNTHKEGKVLMKVLGNNCSKGHKCQPQQGHRTQLKLSDTHQRAIGSETTQS